MKKIFFCMLCLLIFTASAMAVTYRNDGASVIEVKAADGSFTRLAPTESITTTYYNEHADLTKTSDLPYYNRMVAVSTVTLAAEASTVTILNRTDYLVIVQITGTVNAFIQNISNTPAELTLWTKNDPIIQIPAKERFDSLILTGSGTCVVHQYENID